MDMIIHCVISSCSILLQQYILHIQKMKSWKKVLSQLYQEESITLKEFPAGP